MKYRALGVFLGALLMAACAGTDPDEAELTWSGTYLLTLEASPSCGALHS